MSFIQAGLRIALPERVVFGGAGGSGGGGVLCCILGVGGSGDEGVLCCILGVGGLTGCWNVSGVGRNGGVAFCMTWGFSFVVMIILLILWFNLACLPALMMWELGASCFLMYSVGSHPSGVCTRMALPGSISSGWIVIGSLGGLLRYFRQISHLLIMSSIWPFIPCQYMMYFVGVVVQWLDYLAVTQEPSVRFPAAEKMASHVAPP